MTACRTPVGTAVLLTLLIAGGFCCDAQTVAGRAVRLSYHDLHQEWTARIEVESWRWAPGDKIRLPVKMNASFPFYQNDPKAWDGVYLALWAERLYDEHGAATMLSNVHMSGRLTATGRPVESNLVEPPLASLGGTYGSPIEAWRYFPKSALTVHSGAFAIDSDLEFRIPADCPPGIYRLYLRLIADLPVPEASELEPRRFLSDPVRRLMAAASADITRFAASRTVFRFLIPAGFLPAVRIGNPATPKMVVSLFSNTLANGIQGLISNEDRGQFGLSPRTRPGGELVLPPGSYSLAPSPIAYFPATAIAGTGDGADAVPDRIPDYFDFAECRMDLEIAYPDGTRTALRGVRPSAIRGGVLILKPEPFDFTQMGRHRITLDGQIRDKVGNFYRFGGHYDFWVAYPMSFSTAGKIGTSYFEGSRFPVKMQIHPPAPAYVKLEVRYYPRSDAERLQTAHYEGYANEFGYFVPPADQPPLVFREPGEYTARLLAAFRDPRGRLWIGSQDSAGIVAQNDPPVILHGMRTNFLCDIDCQAPNCNLKDRYNFHNENSTWQIAPDFSHCSENNPAPYHSGDAMFVATNFDGANNIFLQMSQEIRPSKLHEEFRAMGRDDRFSGNHDILQRLPDHPCFRKIWRVNDFSRATFLRGEPGDEDQFPILSRTDRGWSPADFPERIRFDNYTYVTAIRPGFSAFSLVSDSNAFLADWYTSPNQFGLQFNAGPTGDLPSDNYRVDGGLVVRDLASGLSSYSAYASSVVILPPESYADRVVEPGAEPLLVVNGRKFPLYLGVEVGSVLHPGQSLSLSAMVFPPVPAAVRMEMTSPSGRQTVVEGEANAIGIFAKPEGVVRLEEPGVYRVRATARYKGVAGGVVGTARDEYLHFVADSQRAPLANIALPPEQRFDPSGTVPIRLQMAEGLRDLTVNWIVFCPGIVMDQGTAHLPGPEFVYRFIPTQFAMQFPNFQVVDAISGTPGLAKSVFFVFFVEGTDSDGRRVHDVKILWTRGNRLFHSPVKLQPNRESQRELARAPS
jgi:hypothetical protein